MTKCILCKTDGVSITFNNIDMFKCLECGLVWRQEFDIPIKHYEDKEINLSSEKIKDRIDNCRDRVKTFGKYTDLNNLCDVGCGEGIFLKVVKDHDYVNSVGVDPSDKVSDFAKQNDLKIDKGTVDDVCDFVKKNNIHTLTMLHLIEHLSDPLKALTNINACLSEGDCIVIETPDIDSYMFKASKYKHDLIYPEHLFYFNRKNLAKLIEKSGFSIIKSGKRDFNQRNINVRNSLQKLGLLSAFSKSTNLHKLSDNLKSKQAFVRRVPTSGLFRCLVRKMLSKLVVIFNRTDYQWVVAKK